VAECGKSQGVWGTGPPDARLCLRSRGAQSVARGSSRTWDAVNKFGFSRFVVGAPKGLWWVPRLWMAPAPSAAWLGTGFCSQLLRYQVRKGGIWAGAPTGGSCPDGGRAARREALADSPFRTC